MEQHAEYSPVLFEETAARAQPLRLAPPPPRPPSLPARAVWADVCAGSLRVAAIRYEPREALLVLRPHIADPGAAVTERRLRVLSLVLDGVSECAVAIELQIAASTVSQEVKQALLCLQLEPRLSALPLPIAQLYHAAAVDGSLEVRAGSGTDGASLTVVFPRPEVDLACLAPAEHRICELILIGKTHAQIAALRGRSARTIANQLASIFSKLHVSGRLELVCLLAGRPIRPC
ncbi:MAG: LuxR family transcriptional regulator [Myxococcales bacterium]|nr:MAG: LuxR family transcriptional regulator [Myxococcales bacterium]